jgi:hypothetical protein
MSFLNLACCCFSKTASNEECLFISFQYLTQATIHLGADTPVSRNFKSDCKSMGY